MLTRQIKALLAWVPQNPLPSSMQCVVVGKHKNSEPHCSRQFINWRRDFLDGSVSVVKRKDGRVVLHPFESIRLL